MTKFNARRGFTLLELLTVLSVLSVVTTIGATAFVKMATVWGETSSGMELNAKTADVFNTIRSDMERIASARRTGQSIQGLDRLQTEKKINRHIPQDDHLTIPVYQRSQGNGPWQQISVEYSIDRSGAVPTLVRKVGPAGGAPTSELVIAENVLAMNIKYLDRNNAWAEEWSRPELPAAIRISLTIGLSNRPNESISREAVFPIHVR